MALTEANMGLTYGWALGESGWQTGMDNNLKKLGAIVGLSVISRVVATPPVAPVDGDRYIIPAAATGVWTGLTGQVAVQNAGAWAYYPPKTGWLCYIENEAVLSAYKPAGWSAGIAI